MSYQIIRSFLTQSRYFLNFKRNIHIHRTLYGTHYDTLNLPRNCTSKEVRDSFIKLSKKCHPDRNQDDPGTHNKFVKLNEAYSVLSRPDKRRAYDLSLKPVSSERYHRPSGNSPFDVYTTAYRQRVVWKDESFWEYKDKNTYGDFSQSGDYYGIRGMKRVPNGWIAILCVVFAAVGVWIQVLLIKYSTTFNRQAMDVRSQETSKVLSDVQERAQRHGNKIQLELLKQRLDTSKNSSKSSNRTSVPPPPEDKKITTKEDESSNPYDTTGPTTVVLHDAGYYSKTNLGYLGDMPHTVRNDVVPEENLFKPELDSLPRNKSRENNESRQILPKPILFHTPNRRNLDKTTEQNSNNPVVSSISNDFCKKNDTATELNLSKLVFYKKSDNVGLKNEDVTDENVAIQGILTSTKFENDDERKIIRKDLIDVKHLKMVRL